MFLTRVNHLCLSLELLIFRIMTLTAHFKPPKRRFLSQKSNTIPGQAYSVKSLIKSFQAGTLPAIGKSVFFEDENDVESDVNNPFLGFDGDRADMAMLLRDHRLNTASAIEDFKLSHQVKKVDTVDTQQSDSTVE